jgi:hypothetical protein
VLGQGIPSWRVMGPALVLGLPWPVLEKLLESFCMLLREQQEWVWTHGGLHVEGSCLTTKPPDVETVTRLSTMIGPPNPALPEATHSWTFCLHEPINSFPLTIA